MEQFIKTLKGGTFGIYIASITPKRLNKGGRKGIPTNPLADKVYTLAVYQNAIVGCNYRNLIKSECIREGIDISDFDTIFPIGETYTTTDDEKIHTHKDGCTKYLRVYLSDGRERSKVKYETLIKEDDGTYRRPTDAENETIKQYTPSASTSEKQAELGMKNIIKVRNITLTNILFIKQGSKEWKSSDNVTIPTDLKELFK